MYLRGVADFSFDSKGKIENHGIKKSHNTPSSKLWKNASELPEMGHPQSLLSMRLYFSFIVITLNAVQMVSLQ